MNTNFIEHFGQALRSPTPPTVRDPRLLMDKDGDISIYYAPFEYINPQARIVLVGITPGPTQMQNANNIARQALLQGKTGEQSIREAKETAAFSGEPMRTNLTTQMNHWGIHTWLGIQDAGELFNSARHLVQTTSLLRYPVFVRGEDYRGTPDMTRHPLLRRYLLEHFGQEVRKLGDALFFALGPQVQKVMERLIAEGLLPSDRLVRGLLHPSGNNTYRINYLVGKRETPPPHATNPEPYDHGRLAFRAAYLNNPN